jgi:hypothetical protein
MVRAAEVFLPWLCLRLALVCGVKGGPSMQNTPSISWQQLPPDAVLGLAFSHVLPTQAWSLVGRQAVNKVACSALPLSRPCLVLKWMCFGPQPESRCVYRERVPPFAASSGACVYQVACTGIADRGTGRAGSAQSQQPGVVRTSLVHARCGTEDLPVCTAAEHCSIALGLEAGVTQL